MAARHDITHIAIQPIHIMSDDIVNDAPMIRLLCENTETVGGAAAITAAVRRSAVMACMIFPAIYGMTLRPERAVTAMTCRWTHSPEKPTTNDVRSSFCAIGASSAEILRVPDENSHIPVIMASVIGSRGYDVMTALAIDEKKIIEKQTVRIFSVEVLSAAEKASAADAVVIFTCVGGELWRSV